MIEPTSHRQQPDQQRLDRHLLWSVVLPVLASGISTIVGFSVAHWITLTASKTAGFIVSFAAFALCAVAAVLAGGALRKLGEGDETKPEHGRRLFMAKLGLMLSAMATILVIAGTLVLFTLRPND